MVQGHTNGGLRDESRSKVRVGVAQSHNNFCPTPLDFPYMFTIPSGLEKSFVLFSYRHFTV